MKLLIFLIIGLVGVSAHAGTTECRSNVNLSCYLMYKQTDAKSVFGPSLSNPVVDQQPEPFDPSDCEASVVFMTELGKVVAVYSDESQTMRAWINAGAADQQLLNNVKISATKSASVVIPANGNSSFKSMTLSCSLYISE